MAGKTETKLVCAKCGRDWEHPGSPAVCPVCTQSSYAVAVLDTYPGPIRQIKHCGNCRLQEFCPAAEGDFGNRNCTNWTQKLSDRIVEGLPLETNN